MKLVAFNNRIVDCFMLLMIWWEKINKQHVIFFHNILLYFNALFDYYSQTIDTILSIHCKSEVIVLSIYEPKFLPVYSNSLNLLFTTSPESYRATTSISKEGNLPLISFFFKLQVAITIFKWDGLREFFCFSLCSMVVLRKFFSYLSGSLTLYHFSTFWDLKWMTWFSRDSTTP